MRLANLDAMRECWLIEWHNKLFKCLVVKQSEKFDFITIPSSVTQYSVFRVVSGSGGF